MQKFNPVQVTVKTEEGEQLVEVYFDVTLIVQQDNTIKTVDNSVEDYHDFVDCNTLCIHKTKIPIT